MIARTLVSADSFTWEKDPRGANNWRLSVERAEVTRRFLAGLRIENERFMRIEGVADREPYNRKTALIPATVGCRSSSAGADQA
jgi:hypothetical protein